MFFVLLFLNATVFQFQYSEVLYSKILAVYYCEFSNEFETDNVFEYRKYLHEKADIDIPTSDEFYSMKEIVLGKFRQRNKISVFIWEVKTKLYAYYLCGGSPELDSHLKEFFKAL